MDHIRNQHRDYSLCEAAVDEVAQILAQDGIRVRWQVRLSIGR